MATAVIVGVGGLGSPLALALALRGETVILVDHDRVELSNLPRQILYRSEDVGRPKVLAAADALVRRGVPPARIEPIMAPWHPGLRGDVVYEGSDDLPTKFAVNDACVAAGTPCTIGGVLRHEGQVFQVLPGGACYRCLFEAPPAEGDAPSCGDAGVLGPSCLLVAAEMLRAAPGLLILPEGRRVNVRRRRGCPAHPEDRS
jgi:molybdopterin/thiamine biosynthesis adenylyltransferase